MAEFASEVRNALAYMNRANMQFQSAVVEEMFKDDMGEANFTTKYWGLVSACAVTFTILGLFLYVVFRIGRGKHILHTYI